MARQAARIEPHDPVVHQDTGLGQDDLTAERAQQSLGQCDHIAFAVDGREMRRARWVAGIVGVAHRGEACLICRFQRRRIMRVGLSARTAVLESDLTVDPESVSNMVGRP